MMSENIKKYNGDTMINLFSVVKYTVSWWRLILSVGAASAIVGAAVCAIFRLVKPALELSVRDIAVWSVIGAVLGAFLTAAVVLVYALFSNKLRGAADLPAQSPLIGCTARKSTNGFLVKFGPRSKAVGITEDAYSQILCSLSLQQQIAENNIIVFSSDNINRQRASVVLNIASAAAESGARVLLIDADYTSGALTELVGADSSKGFSNLLFALCTADDITTELEKQNVFFMPSGKLPALFYKKLAVGDHRRILAKLSSQYDYIFINASHIGSYAADALMIAEASAGMVLVTSKDETNFDSYFRAYEKLGRTNITFLGNIMAV